MIHGQDGKALKRRRSFSALGTQDPSGASANEFEDRARARLRSARSLYLSDHITAYEIAGGAIEFALKARIMRFERLNSWPSKDFRRELHVHQLGTLAQYAGVKVQLETMAMAGSQLGIAWLVIKDWDITKRYPDGSQFPAKLAEDLLNSAESGPGKGGMLEWLLTK